MEQQEFKPGERVPESGLYRVVQDAGEEHQVTAVKGERFPPSRTGKGIRYVLAQAALHLREHHALDTEKAESPSSS